MVQLPSLSGYAPLGQALFLRLLPPLEKVSINKASLSMDVVRARNAFVKIFV